MTREDAIQCLATLKVAYPRFYSGMNRNDAENTIGLWSTMFAGDSVEDVKLAIQVLIASSEWPPSIAEVRKTMAANARGQEVNVSDAWGEVITAIRRFGYMRETDALESLSEQTRRVVRSMGWKNLCQSEDSMADRAHFLRLYGEVGKSTAREQCLPQNVAAQIAAKSGVNIGKLFAIEGGKE